LKIENIFRDCVGLVVFQHGGVLSFRCLLGPLQIGFCIDYFLLICQESLKYRLLGSEGDIGSWGHEYVRWE